MTVRTASAMQGQIDALLADNVAGDISAADARSLFEDCKDSFAFLRAFDLLVLRVEALEGGNPPPATDITVFFGTSADAVPEPAELTIEADVGRGVVPAYAGDMRLLIARLASEPDIVKVLFSDDPSNTNQIGAFAKFAMEVEPAGEAEDYAVWVSNQDLTQTADLTITVS